MNSLTIIETKEIGSNVTIGEFSVIRAGAKIGSNVVIHPHVIIAGGVEIGDGVEIFPGAVIGKEPKGAGALARTPVFTRRVKIGAGSSVGPHAVIFFDVAIGENTLLGDGVSIREQCCIGSRCILSRYVTINYASQVGDQTKIMDTTHITGKCTIGKRVFIGMSVITANDNAMGRDGYHDERVCGPTIEDEARIGSGAVILPGIRVGKGALVGANAVVSRHVEAGRVVVGIPARVVPSGS